MPNIDGTMGHTIKTRKHPRHGTQCVIQYPTNRAQHNPFKRMQSLIWASVVQLVAKISERLESVKTEKFKFELDKFRELILISQKCPTMSPHQEAIASSTSSLI